MKTVLVVLFSIASIGMSAQTINIADSSVRGSPVSFVGTVKFDDKLATCYLIGAKVSTKTIYQVGFILKITRPDGVYGELTWTHLHRKGISVNQQFAAIDGDCSPSPELANNIKHTTEPMSASVELVGVRYMDGSTWGDQKIFQ
jgi:hypothetical protein